MDVINCYNFADKVYARHIVTCTLELAGIVRHFSDAFYAHTYGQRTVEGSEGTSLLVCCALSAGKYLLTF